MLLFKVVLSGSHLLTLTRLSLVRNALLGWLPARVSDLCCSIVWFRLPPPSPQCPRLRPQNDLLVLQFNPALSHFIALLVERSSESSCYASRCFLKFNLPFRFKLKCCSSHDVFSFLKPKSWLSLSSHAMVFHLAGIKHVCLSKHLPHG